MWHLYYPLVVYYILSISLEIECMSTRRFNYDAVLYEEYSVHSKSVQFSRTSKDLWKNMSNLVESNGMLDDSMLCTRGKGCWFGFPFENYAAKGLKYVLIVGENCMPAKMMRSLTPVGEMRRRMDNSLVMFSSPHFGGTQQSMMDKDETASMDAQSLVSFGAKEYLIEGAGPLGPMKVCMKPMRDMAVCIMKDVDASLGMSGAKSFKSGGCMTMEDVRVMYLETCYDPGMHDLKHNEDMSPRNLQKMCTDDVEQSTKNDMALIMEIYDSRVRRQLQSREPISMPSEGNYKVMMLVEIMKICEDICNIDSDYLGILQNVFLMRLRAVWDMQISQIGVEDDKWKEMINYLESCRTAATIGVDKSGIGSTPCAQYESVPQSFQEEHVLEEMMDGDDFDVVIDQMWMIFVMVTPYCNTANEYDDNKWAEMTSVLKQYYLIPLKSSWRGGTGNWQQLYSTMFHGFDIDEQRRSIISCAHNMLKKNSARDPMGRMSWIDDVEMEPIVKARKIGK